MTRKKGADSGGRLQENVESVSNRSDVSFALTRSETVEEGRAWKVWPMKLFSAVLPQEA